MAVNEKQFQTELIADAKRQGLFAYKNVPDFNKGIPDLTIVGDVAGVGDLKSFGYVPCCDVWWAELKFINSLKSRPKHFRVELTEFQRHFLRKLRDHHADVCWVLGVRLGLREWWAYASQDLEQTVVTMAQIEAYGVRRELGQPWDVKTIINRSGVQK